MTGTNAMPKTMVRNLALLPDASIGQATSRESRSSVEQHDADERCCGRQRPTAGLRLDERGVVRSVPTQNDREVDDHDEQEDQVGGGNRGQRHRERRACRVGDGDSNGSMRPRVRNHAAGVEGDEHRQRPSAERQRSIRRDPTEDAPDERVLTVEAPKPSHQQRECQVVRVSHREQDAMIDDDASIAESVHDVPHTQQQRRGVDHESEHLVADHVTCRWTARYNST